MKRKFKFIDLFCWLWGFRIALESVWWECVFSSDIDKYVQDVYENNFWERPFGDIKKINEKEIPQHDILCWGFPCQPFSIAWKRLWFEDNRWTLFFDIYRIVKEKQPKIVFLENVKWLVNHDNGRTLEIIKNSLNDLWYDIKFKILNAQKFWLPQNRERFILVWFNKKLLSIDNFNIPDSNCLLPAKLKDFINFLDEEKNITEICDVNMKSHFNENIKKLIEKWEIVLAHNVRPSKCSFAYKNISPCLTAKMWTWWNNVPIIANFSRKLSVRECLNLMWFPENYKIKENYSQSYKQIWNSVAIPMIKEVAKEIIKFI